MREALEPLLLPLFLGILFASIGFPILIAFCGWFLSRIFVVTGTVIVFGAYVLYEWIMPSEVNIRIDLLLLYPAMLLYMILAILSLVFSYFRMKRQRDAPSLEFR